MRLLALAQWGHFAGFVISIAMLGLAASGLFLHFRRERIEADAAGYFAAVATLPVEHDRLGGALFCLVVRHGPIPSDTAAGAGDNTGGPGGVCNRRALAVANHLYHRRAPGLCHRHLDALSLFRIQGLVEDADAARSQNRGPALQPLWCRPLRSLAFYPLPAGLVAELHRLAAASGTGLCGRLGNGGGFRRRPGAERSDLSADVPRGVFISVAGASPSAAGLRRSGGNSQGAGAPGSGSGERG